MPNTFNYADKFSPDLLEIVNQQALCSPFIASSLEWLDAKNFKFTQMSVSGYKDHSRTSNAYNSGTLTQTGKVFTLTHDRDISFAVDKADIDETNKTASIANIAKTFTLTQDIPEKDAYFFSKVATTAIAIGATNYSATTQTTLTSATIVAYLTGIIGKSKLKYYRANGSLILYVDGVIMDLLSQAPTFTRNIESTTLTDNGVGVETRITELNNVPLIEVIDTERFYTSFNFTEGYVPATGAFKINVLACTPQTTKMVPKFADMFYADADADHPSPRVSIRNYWDVFTFPNGKSGVVDSVFVDRDTVAVA